jgi:hypothetical protein
MKKLNITWDGVADPTGYLFSFAKSLSCAVRYSPWQEYTEDIVATSGFAFRMWVAAELCPSATSIWSFDCQKPWVESGGLLCDYTGRFWGQDEIEEQKRLEAIELIKKSIDNNIPAVVWDVGVPEWGLITGYDDERQVFSTLAVNYSEGEMPYEILGKREIPILSVLTITGAGDKTKAEILKDTVKLALGHLQGEEWCENKKGLEAYPALLEWFNNEIDPNNSWSTEYYLGTYASLKYYAWKYFKKEKQEKLAEIYKDIHESWLQGFQIKTSEDIGQAAVREKIFVLLAFAYEKEKEAAEVMAAYN